MIGAATCPMMQTDATFLGAAMCLVLQHDGGLDSCNMLGVATCFGVLGCISLSGAETSFSERRKLPKRRPQAWSAVCMVRQIDIICLGARVVLQDVLEWEGGEGGLGACNVLGVLANVTCFCCCGVPGAATCSGLEACAICLVLQHACGICGVPGAADQCNMLVIFQCACKITAMHACGIDAIPHAQGV